MAVIDPMNVPDPRAAAYPGPTPGLARIHRIRHAGGVSLVVHDAEHALDPAALLRTLGAGVCSAESERGDEALPGDLHSGVIVDDSLLALDAVTIELADGPVTLDRSGVGRLLGDCPRASLCRTVSIDGDRGRDFEQDGARLRERVSSLTARRVNRRLDEALNIPPLKPSAQQLIQLQCRDDYDVSDLVAVVECDAPLASQIVGWANSSLYNAPGTVASIQDAIVRVLGVDLVMNLALGLAVSQTLRIPERDQGWTFRFWQRSVCTAALAESLARSGRRPRSGLAYIAGLLHDFGDLVLAHCFPPYHQELQNAIELNGHLHPEKLEHTWLGLTRAQIGAHLLDNWSLPVDSIVAIRRQNDPAAVRETNGQVDVLHLTKRLLAERGQAEMQGCPELTDADFAGLDLTLEAARELREIILSAIAELDGLCGALAGQ